MTINTGALSKWFQVPQVCYRTRALAHVTVRRSAGVPIHLAGANVHRSRMRSSEPFSDRAPESIAKAWRLVHQRGNQHLQKYRHFNSLRPRRN